MNKKTFIVKAPWYEDAQVTLQVDLDILTPALATEIKVGGVYAATQGPRLETAAEINRFERDGADLVGMTGMPEAVLARELELPYAAINVIANHAAGRGDSVNGIHFESLEHVLHDAMWRVRSIIERLVGCQDNCAPMGMSV